MRQANRKPLRCPTILPYTVSHPEQSGIGSYSDAFIHQKRARGSGATCKLVMLPHESHGYRARESVMHMAHEMTDWLEKFVKNAGPRETVDPKDAAHDKAS